MNAFRRTCSLLLSLLLIFTLAALVLADGDESSTSDSSYYWLPEGTEAESETEDPHGVQKCLGYNIVEGTVTKNKPFTLELVLYDSQSYSLSVLRKNYVSVGNCAFYQSPANSIASTLTIHKTNRQVLVRLEGLVWSGEGNELTVDVGYSLNNYDRDVSISLVIREAPSTSESTGSWSALSPTLLVDSYTPVEAGYIPAEEGEDEETPEAIRPLAGQPFTLLCNLRNASSSVKVLNLVVKVSGGEVFSLTEGTDTVYISSLAAGGSEQLVLPLTTAANQTPGSHPVTLTLEYEYYDNGSKSGGSDTLTLMVPVTQEDRIREGTLSVDYATVGAETYLTYDFVNTGFTTLYNAEVQVYDAYDNLLAGKYIGSVEPSKEIKGTDLSIVLSEAGSQTLRVVLAYEDEQMNAKTYETSVEAYAEEEYWEEPIWDEPIEDPTEEESSVNLPLIIGLIAGGAVLAGVVVLIVILSKKHKAKVQAEMEGDYEDL